MTAILKSRLPVIAAELKPRMDAALKIGAEAVEQGAKDRVRQRSGDLHDAIHTEEAGGTAYAVVAGDDDVFWGHMLEHGTSHSPPFPFLVPALEAERGKIVGLVSEVIHTL